MTYGLGRSEILSAQFNGATLLILGLLIVYEGIRRLIDPPAVEGGIVLVVALIGVVVNVVAVAVLHGADRRSLNVEGAFQHVLTDLVAFIATAVAGLVILSDRVRPRGRSRVAVRRGRDAPGRVVPVARLGPDLPGGGAAGDRRGSRWARR